MEYSRGGGVEELGKNLKRLEGLAFYHFPNVDQFSQITRKTGFTDYLKEENNLK